LVELNCYWNRDDRYYKNGGWKGTKELDGGTLFTQFSHFIDIMYWLFGDIKNIQASFNDFNHSKSTDFEDSGIVGFDFEDVVQTQVYLSDLNHYKPMNAVYAKYVGDRPPARAVVQAARIPRDALVEIMMVAQKP